MRKGSDFMNIGNKIKEYREKNKMTQKDIAKILGVEPGTISKYESGMIEPNIESIKKLAETFQISIDELLADENDFDVSKVNVLKVLREQKEMKLKGNLYHQTQISFAYNTNHIEGSTLTEEQTRYIFETNTILFEGNTVAKVDDILETSNHFKLVDYMLDVADKKLTEKMIKEFHKILKDGTSDSRKEWFNVGDYKKVANTIGSGIKTTSPQNVEKDMKKLMEWYNNLKQITIKEIIEFHYRFESIHPFQDGNGRIGRLIMFKECLKNNVIPFIIQDADKLFYYRGLKEYKSEKGYLVDTCLNSQDQYIKMIEYYLK
jgi:Fic family protein